MNLLRHAGLAASAPPIDHKQFALFHGLANLQDKAAIQAETKRKPMSGSARSQLLLNRRPPNYAWRVDSLDLPHVYTKLRRFPDLRLRRFPQRKVSPIKIALRPAPDRQQSNNIPRLLKHLALRRDRFDGDLQERARIDAPAFCSEL
jgi:hypothetical protein